MEHPTDLEELPSFDAGPPPPPSAKNGRRPTKTLPSPRLAVPKQLDVLRAFTNASQSEDWGPVGGHKAAQLVGMSQQTIVVAFPFLTEVGLLIRKGPSNYEVSEDAKAYQSAYEWNPATAAEKLRPAFVDKWFSRCLLPRLKMRSLSKQEATQALAEASGASKEYEENLAALLEYMSLVGLITMNGGIIEPISSPGISADAQQAQLTPPPTLATAGALVAPPAQESKGDVCWLDRERTRKVVVDAPLDITNDEVTRLKAWIDLNYFVKDLRPQAAPAEGAS